MILYYDIIPFKGNFKLIITASNKDCIDINDFLNRIKQYMKDDPIITEYNILEDIVIKEQKDTIIKLEGLLERKSL